MVFKPHDQAKVISDAKMAREKIGDHTWVFYIRNECAWCEKPMRNSRTHFWKYGNSCKSCSDGCSRRIKEQQHRNEENRLFFTTLLDPNRKYEVRWQRQRMRQKDRLTEHPEE